MNKRVGQVIVKVWVAAGIAVVGATAGANPLNTPGTPSGSLVGTIVPAERVMAVQLGARDVTRPEPRAKSCPGGCGRTTLRGATDGEPRAEPSLVVSRSRARVDGQQPACPGGCGKGSRASDDTERSSRRRASPSMPALAKTGHATGQTCPGGCSRAGRQVGSAEMR